MQQVLFNSSHFNYFENYNKIFKCFPSDILDERVKFRGRPSFPKDAMIKSLVYMALNGISSLSQLHFELLKNAQLSEVCGFDILKEIPTIEKFSSFLKDTNNNLLSKIRNHLVKELINYGHIKDDSLSIDNCPIISPVRENNLKTIVKERYNKNKLPKGDTDARLGIIANFHSGKKIQYYWGYKNHVVIDADSELPIWEVTYPANVHETKVFIPIFTNIQKEFEFKINNVIGDSAFDTECIINFIVKELKAKPIIAHNPRNLKSSNNIIKKSYKVVCIAGLEMADRGSAFMKSQNKTYRIYACPIHHYKKLRKKYICCPMNHPKFFSQKGCYYTERIDNENKIRNSIDYDSETFKKLYCKRTGSERLFSRLLNLCMQNISVRSLNSVKNKCTIAHITVLLVASATVKLGYPDKIRFVKTFVHNFLIN